MSVRVMGLCWEIPLDPSSKLLLLALADHANDAGRSVYPGNKRLARKVSLQIRQTQILLSHLEDHDLIRREKYLRGGRGHAVEWALNIPLLELLFERVQSGTPFPVNNAFQCQKGCTLVPESMHSNAPQPSRTIKNHSDLEIEEEEIGIRLPGETRADMLKRLLSEIGKEIPE